MTQGELRFLGWSTLVAGGAVVAFFFWAAGLPSTEEEQRLTAANELKAAEAVVDASRTDCRFAVPVPPPAAVTKAKGKRAHTATHPAVADFDVQGVRLYEPVRDVMAALAKNGLLKGGDRTIGLTDCAADDIKQERQQTADQASYNETAKSCVGDIFYKVRNADLKVEFFRRPSHAAELHGREQGLVVATGLGKQRLGESLGRSATRQIREAAQSPRIHG